MMALTRWFGVTESEAQRCPAREKADIEEIAVKSLLMQKNAATAQHRSLCRGTHANGVCVRAQFEVFDMGAKHAPERAARLAKGIFAQPGLYPAVVRFANADSKINSDFKPDVRSLSFSVDLSRDGVSADGSSVRQDFSMQNATTLPINDSPAFLATIKVLTASSPAACLWSLPFKDKLKVVRTLALAERQARQKIKPYQQLRYWSTVPFRHGRIDVVKFSAIPFLDNPAQSLQKSNPKGLQDELIRHLKERRQDERVRFCGSVSRCRKDDILGQTSRRKLLDRERQCRVERSRGALPLSRAAYPRTEFAAFIGGERSDLFRRHWKLDAGQHARWEHQSRSLACGSCQQESASACSRTPNVTWL